MGFEYLSSFVYHFNMVTRTCIALCNQPFVWGRFDSVLIVFAVPIFTPTNASREIWEYSLNNKYYVTAEIQHKVINYTMDYESHQHLFTERERI